VERLIEILLTDPRYEMVRWPTLTAVAILFILSTASKIVEIGYRRVERRKLEAELLRTAADISVTSPSNEHVSAEAQVERKVTPNDKQLIQRVLLSLLEMDFTALDQIASETDSLELGKSVLGIRLGLCMWISVFAALPPLAATALVAIPAFGLLSRFTPFVFVTFLILLPLFIAIAVGAGAYAGWKTGVLVSEQGLKNDSAIFRIQISSLWLGTGGVILVTFAAMVI
jgi:hypothetical protein